MASRNERILQRNSGVKTAIYPAKAVGTDTHLSAKRVIRPSGLFLGCPRSDKDCSGQEPQSHSSANKHSETVSITHCTIRHELKRTCRPNLWRSHWLRHPIKDDHSLTAAAGRKCFVGRTHTAIDILPVVADPNVAGWIDADVNLHL